MTNKERHIAVLNRMLESMDVYDSIQPTTERKKAIKAAIKALEQQTCEDAISRQEVLDQTYLWSKDEFLRVTNPFDYLRKRINSLPPVTPQQKYGKWIKHPEIETSTPEYLMFYECSECGDKQCFYKLDLHKKRFCNSCGVKMQESEEV